MSVDHDHVHDDVAVRAAALEALLVEKGLISTDAIDAVVDLYENDVGPQNGARIVALAARMVGLSALPREIAASTLPGMSDPSL